VWVEVLLVGYIMCMRGIELLYYRVNCWCDLVFGDDLQDLLAELVGPTHKATWNAVLAEVGITYITAMRAATSEYNSRLNGIYVIVHAYGTGFILLLL
jgi:hypothetical protein